MRSFFFIFLSMPLSSEQELPFKVGPLYDFSQPETLGLSFAKSSQTFTIFSPGKNDNKYNHGVVLYPFKGMLYAQWQSSALDEDAPDTRVVYSRSSNGKDWSSPIALTAISSKEITTSGGWWSHGDTLVAFINVWFQRKDSVREGYTLYKISGDGIHWSDPKPVTNINGKPLTGIIEQDLHALPNGRIITAFHMQPGLIATPFYTDDPMGITGWQAGNMKGMEIRNNMSRGIEPSWFYRKDGAVVMVFRDQENTFKKLASVTCDNGLNWTTPVIVNAPDSRAKQSAGNLPGGAAYMVNNPSGNRNRFPLVITISRDGSVFDKAFLLRSGGKDLPTLRFNGKYKRAGYSYPKSVVWDNYLYIGYATNKEDVELTRIPVSDLQY